MTPSIPTKPCKESIRFGTNVEHYIKHWSGLRPPGPTSCPFTDCDGGAMGYHGHYKRCVILPNFSSEPFGVHRYRCATCKRTLSFLPDFCVPYKHFGSDIIFLVLQFLLFFGHSVREVSNPFGSLNSFGLSRWCVNEWLCQFERNSHNLWHFGLLRLLNPPPVPEDSAGLLRYFVDFSADDIESSAHTFRPAQIALSKEFPPFGLFRAQLLPGCVT